MLYMKHNSTQANLIMHTLPHIHTCTDIHTHLQPLAFLSPSLSAQYCQCCPSILCDPVCLLSAYQEEKHQALVKKRDILDKKLVQSEKTGAKIVRHASVVGDTRSGKMFLFSVVIVFRSVFSLC